MIPPQEWVIYDLPPVCQAPGCDQPREWGGGHHVIRRSATGGPVDWVSIDGLVIPNRVALCTLCHRGVTGEIGGHRYHIRFPTIEQIEAELYSPWWLWYARMPAGWRLAGPLDPVLR